MLARAPFPGYGTDSNKLVQQMTAKRSGRPRITTPGEFGTSGSFIYEIEPLPHQPLQPEYLDCEESAHKQSATGFDSIRPRRPYFRAVLTPLHRRDRFRWCNRLRDWTFRSWREFLQRRVSFSAAEM
jgi:hypothetical protein